MLWKTNHNFNDTVSSILGHPFRPSIPILYLLKTSKNQRFSGVFRGYKIGILVRNWLIMKEKKAGPNFCANCWNFLGYGVSLCIQSECVKIRTRKTPNTDTFHVVYFSDYLF